MVDSPIPTTLRTARLLLRPWAPTDATALAPILAVNAARLAPWLPARVAAPAPPAELAERLAGYAADFEARRTFRYALLAADGALLGGASLHPRAAAGRVPLAEATCIELGYWLAAEAEGRGLALEAARALLDVAATLPGLTHAEARVDPRNRRSAAVAQRLGFHHGGVEAGLDVWRLDLTAARDAHAAGI